MPAFGVISRPHAANVPCPLFAQQQTTSEPQEHQCDQQRPEGQRDPEPPVRSCGAGQPWWPKPVRARKLHGLREPITLWNGSGALGSMMIG